MITVSDYQTLLIDELRRMTNSPAASTPRLTRSQEREDGVSYICHPRPVIRQLRFAEKLVGRNTVLQANPLDKRRSLKRDTEEPPLSNASSCRNTVLRETLLENGGAPGPCLGERPALP